MHTHSHTDPHSHDHGPSGHDHGPGGHDHGPGRHDHGPGGHDHGPGGHDHGPGGEPNYAARRHPEPVILDIGGDLGALIVHTEAGMVGVEVEISATGQDDSRTHKDVLEREINGRPAYTAVFDKIREGSYTLWVNDVAWAREVFIVAGAVAELDWSLTPPLVRS
jgi:hypothetical protein